MNPHNTILVIEDDPRMLSATARLLEKSGYRVRTASSGDAGIQSAIEHKPDLVLLDMVLPDIDGLPSCSSASCQPNGSPQRISRSGLKAGPTIILPGRLIIANYLHASGQCSA